MQAHALKKPPHTNKAVGWTGKRRPHTWHTHAHTQSWKGLLCFSYACPVLAVEMDGRSALKSWSAMLCWVTVQTGRQQCPPPPPPQSHVAPLCVSHTFSSALLPSSRVGLESPPVLFSNVFCEFASNWMVLCVQGCASPRFWSVAGAWEEKPVSSCDMNTHLRSADPPSWDSDRMLAWML